MLNINNFQIALSIFLSFVTLILEPSLHCTSSISKKGYKMEKQLEPTTRKEPCNSFHFFQCVSNWKNELFLLSFLYIHKRKLLPFGFTPFLSLPYFDLSDVYTSHSKYTTIICWKKKNNHKPIYVENKYTRKRWIFPSIINRAATPLKMLQLPNLFVGIKYAKRWISSKSGWTALYLLTLWRTNPLHCV